MPPEPMSAAELLEARNVMFWSTAAFARLASASPRKAGRWLSGKAPVPDAITAHVRLVVAFHRANLRPTPEDGAADVMMAGELHTAAAAIGWNVLALGRRLGIRHGEAAQLWASDAPMPPPMAGYLRRLASWHAAHPWPSI